MGKHSRDERDPVSAHLAKVYPQHLPAKAKLRLLLCNLRSASHITESTAQRIVAASGYGHGVLSAVLHCDVDRLHQALPDAMNDWSRMESALIQLYGPLPADLRKARELYEKVCAEWDEEEARIVSAARRRSHGHDGEDQPGLHALDLPAMESANRPTVPQRSVPHYALVVDPRTAEDTADFLRLLRELHVAAGSPNLRDMARVSERALGDLDRRWHQPRSRSTIARMLDPNRDPDARIRPQNVLAVVRGCNITDARTLELWREESNRIERQRQRRLREL